MSWTKLVALAVKIAVTIGLLYLLFRNIDLAPVAERFAKLNIAWAFAAIAALAAQLILIGVRWRIIGAVTGVHFDGPTAVRLMFIGQFFNQVLPSTVGGDGVRVWLLSRQSGALAPTLTSVICDRVIALGILSLIVAAVLPIALLTGANVPAGRAIVVTSYALIIAALVAVLVWSELIIRLLTSHRLLTPLGRLFSDFRKIILAPQSRAPVISLSILSHLLTVLCIFFCARALHVELSLLQLILIPPIIMVASIPISFAGWGLREGAMIAGLGFAGMPAAEALAVSVGFGFTHMLLSLPGALLFLFERRKLPPLNQ